MKRLIAFMTSLALALTFLNDAGAQGRAEWLKKARWGVMTHYLPDWIEPQRKWTSEDWNKLVQPFIEQLNAVKGAFASTPSSQGSSDHRLQ